MTMPVPRRAGILVASLVGLLVAAGPVAADPRKFYGRYAGEAVSEGDGEIETRDISAEIGPKGSGFQVKWTIVVRKKSEPPRRVEYQIAFLPTKRPDLYSAGMRTDVFGNAVPLDPLKGDPYMWAKIDGPTLKMYALFVTEEGGYEIQAYDRTLTPAGMDLKYSRIRDGQTLRTITGKLKKLK